MVDLVGDNSALVKKLSAAGWGVFFIWMGIAFLMNLSWGTGILGVGIITLGGQVARVYFGLAVDRFWLITGFIFLLWGVSELLKIQLGASLLPILCVLVGAVILITALRPKPRH